MFHEKNMFMKIHGRYKWLFLYYNLAKMWTNTVQTTSERCKMLMAKFRKVMSKYNPHNKTTKLSTLHQHNEVVSQSIWECNRIWFLSSQMYSLWAVFGTASLKTK